MFASLLKQHNRIVVDFSFLANIKENSLRKEFMDALISENCEVAVSEDFFENCEIVRQCHFEEQEKLIRTIEDFTDTLKKEKRLFRFENVYSPETVVNTLASNPQICFAFYCFSEFAEWVRPLLDSMKAGALVLCEDGSVQMADDPKELKPVLNLEIDPEIKKKDVVRLKGEFHEGSKVKTRDGETILLGEQIGKGGEGSVFKCNYRGIFGDGYVLKIYHNGKLNVLRLKKLALMSKSPVRYEGICWPEKLIFSMSGEPVGYLMQGISGKNMGSIFTGPDRVRETFPRWTRQDLVRLAIRILQRYQYLHIFGILGGDLRMKNIVLDADGSPNIMDVDSAQVQRIPCPVGFEDFTPPELQGVLFDSQLRTYQNESFSAAVLVFMTLFFGQHPYSQKHAADDITEDIRDARFPYPRPGNQNYDRIPWGGYDKIWRYMPIPFRDFFLEVFKEKKRSTLIEMICLLKAYDRFITKAKDSNPVVNQLIFEEV